MLITLIVIIGLSLLILGHEAGHFVMAKLFGLKVDEFGFGFPPRIFARKKGDTEYSVNWLPFGGFVRIAGENGEFGKAGEDAQAEGDGRLFYRQPAWKRALITFAGVFVNFILGWLLISIIFMVGTPQAVIITGIQKNSPAMTAGFKEGDVVVGFTKVDALIQFINSHRGEPTTFSILRDGRKRSLTVTPRTVTAPGEGAVGILLAEAGVARHSVWSAFGEGLRTSGELVWLTLQGLGQLFGNLFLHASISNDVVGPVGIFSVAQDAGKIGLIYLVQLVSLISLNLAVVNLIPFPALDGGRLFMILIEKIKGSPVSEKTEAFVNSIGFAFLLLLMAVITVHDIARLF